MMMNGMNAGDELLVVEKKSLLDKSIMCVNAHSIVLSSRVRRVIFIDIMSLRIQQ